MGTKVQGDFSDYIAPPIAQGVIDVAVTQTVVVLDLTSMAGWPGNQISVLDTAQLGGRNPNPLAHFITIQADGGPVYVAFAGLATTISAITTTAVTAVGGTNQLATTYTANGCVVITAGTERAWLLPEGPNPQPTATAAGPQPWGANSPARYLALVTNTTTTAIARMWQSSP